MSRPRPRDWAIGLSIGAVVAVVGWHAGIGTEEPGERVAQPVLAEEVRVPIARDVRALTGKMAEEVAALLGEPDRCERIDPSGAEGSVQCAYAGGQTEIVYIDGRADWMTFFLPGVAYSPDALTELFHNEHVIRWESIPGLLGVSVNPAGDGTIHFAYVKWRTP